MSTPLAPPPPSTDAPARRGLSVAALVLGIVALIAALIPFVSYVAGFVAIAAAVLGIVALTRRLAGRGAAITGIVLGVVALILAIVMSIVYSTLFFLAAAVNELPTTLPSIEQTEVPSSEPSSEPGTDQSEAAGTSGGPVLEYEVLGDGAASNVTYLTFNDGGSGTEQVTDVDLPWSETITIADDDLFEISVFSLTAQNADDGEITCRISLDGEVISESTSEGQYAVVNCTGTSE